MNNFVLVKVVNTDYNLVSNGFHSIAVRSLVLFDHRTHIFTFNEFYDVVELVELLEWIIGSDKVLVLDDVWVVKCVCN